MFLALIYFCIHPHQQHTLSPFRITFWCMPASPGPSLPEGMTQEFCSQLWTTISTANGQGWGPTSVCQTRIFLLSNKYVSLVVIMTCNTCLFLFSLRKKYNKNARRYSLYAFKWEIIWLYPWAASADCQRKSLKQGWDATKEDPMPGWPKAAWCCAPNTSTTDVRVGEHTCQQRSELCAHD